MAGGDLIETYLEELAWRVRWRVDGGAIVDELRDHLLSACADGDATGRVSGDVERAAIEQLGPVDEVAGALLTAPGVRLAIPTRLTRAGGAAALVAATAWPLLVVAWLASVVVERRADRFGGASQWLYVSGAAALWLAVAATVVAVVAVCRRYGAGPWQRRTAEGCAALALASSTLSWLVVAWAGLLAAAGVATLLSSAGSNVPSRPGLVALAAAWPAAGLTWVALNSVGLGWRDDAGSYPLAVGAAVAVGAVVASVGCAVVGRRLAQEHPVSDVTAG